MTSDTNLNINCRVPQQLKVIEFSDIQRVRSNESVDNSRVESVTGKVLN